jgi:soluble lytic murein transglycosylase-like protein
VPSATSPADVSRVINEASGRYQLDPDLVNSVIRAESGFKVHAISPKGAQGLMQLMPQTANKLGVPNAFDPAANVDGGTRYLRELLEKYNYDLIKALAAYNAGPQRVEQYGGVPPYRETRHYVASIVRDFNRKKLAQQKAANTAAPKPQTQKPTQPRKQAKSATTPKPAPAPFNTQTTAKKMTPPTGN